MPNTSNNYIFRLSKTIALDFLKIGDESCFIQERGEEILKKLESCYTEEGCSRDGDLKCERQFILKTLPYISSVIQLSSTIRYFNEAMEQVEKTFDLEDKVFEQAIKLSYLVFAYAIDKGCERFSRDYTGVHYPVGSQKDQLRCPPRNELWKEMRDQIEALLSTELTPQPPKGRKGITWYNLAKRYVKQVKNKSEEIENINKNKTGCESDITRIKEEIKRIKDEIEKYTEVAIKNLEEAVMWDQQCKDDVKNDPAFDIDVIQNNAKFKELIGD